MKNTKIRLATEEDRAAVIALWKSNRKTLSPFFEVSLDSIIKKLYVLVVDDKIVGMVSYVNHEDELYVKYLCVDNEYRNQGYARMLLCELVRVAGSKDRKLVAECADGAENNTFYDKYCAMYELMQKKNMVCRKYIIDTALLGVNDLPAHKFAEYHNSLCMTQQFRFCGNPFRIDTYKGCSFGCKYCFANSSQSLYHNDGFAVANMDEIRKQFAKAFDEDKPTNSHVIEMLRHRVPLHCGGMSDPFQKIEFELHTTYELIELSRKYQYPICFSTKTAHLPDEYFKILDPKLHAFQLSIMGWSPEYIRKYEANTPTAQERVEFLIDLRARGFWCAVRIQPCIDIDEVTQLVCNLERWPSYITVEHLKIPVDNEAVKKLFIDDYSTDRFYRSRNNLRNIEMTPKVKRENIEIIKEIAHANGVQVGVGDNDLHHLSDSRCCCGIDTIGPAFDNWLKYNLTYFITGEVEEPLWCPKCNLASCFYSGTRMNSFVGFDEATNKYISDNKDLVPPEHIKKVSDITGVRFTNKLF